MSSVIVSKTTVTSLYNDKDKTSADKVFICKECKRVVVDPASNCGWSKNAKTYGCISGDCTGLSSSQSLVQIKDYRGEKLKKSSGNLNNSSVICHPDMFSVDEEGMIHLETDLTREGRKSLTDYINEQEQNSKTNDLVKQLRGLKTEELADVLNTIFTK